MPCISFACSPSIDTVALVSTSCIKRETGKDIRVIMPKKAAAREAAEDARLMAGVETSATVSMEGLQAKLMQGTGYDPIEQSRRPRRGTST